MGRTARRLLAGTFAVTALLGPAAAETVRLGVQRPAKASRQMGFSTSTGSVAIPVMAFTKPTPRMPMLRAADAPALYDNSGLTGPAAPAVLTYLKSTIKDCTFDGKDGRCVLNALASTVTIRRFSVGKAKYALAFVAYSLDTGEVGLGMAIGLKAEADGSFRVLGAMETGEILNPRVIGASLHRTGAVLVSVAGRRTQAGMLSRQPGRAMILKLALVDKLAASKSLDLTKDRAEAGVVLASAQAASPAATIADATTVATSNRTNGNAIFKESVDPRVRKAEARPASEDQEPFGVFAIRTLKDLYSTDGGVDPRSALARRLYTASLLDADAKASAGAKARDEDWSTLLMKRYGQDLEPVTAKTFSVVGSHEAAVKLQLKPLDPAQARLERFPTRSETVVYTFVREGGSWKIDDVSFLDARGYEVADARFLAFMEAAVGKPLVALPLESGRYEGDPAEYAQGEGAGRCGAVTVDRDGRDIHVAEPLSGKVDDCVTSGMAWEGDGHGIAVSSTCTSRPARSLSLQPMTRRSLWLDGHIYRLCEAFARRSKESSASTSDLFARSGLLHQGAM